MAVRMMMQTMREEKKNWRMKRLRLKRHKEKLESRSLKTRSTRPSSVWRPTSWMKTHKRTRTALQSTKMARVRKTFKVTGNKIHNIDSKKKQKTTIILQTNLDSLPVITKAVLLADKLAYILPHRTLSKNSINYKHLFV